MNVYQIALRAALRVKKAYEAPRFRFKNEQFGFDYDDNHYYLSIAGSNDFSDWIQNLTAWRPWLFQKRIPGTPFKGTRGYVNAAINILEAVEKRLRKTIPIKMAGHSKGGAVAPILAMMLNAQGYHVEDIITFAAPRFSTMRIDDSTMISVKRFVCMSDIVPDYPSSNMLRKWRHVGQEFIIGNQINDSFGVIRDAIQAHLIDNYISTLKEYK